MPFQKGQSGNPGGRPKAVIDLQKLIANHKDLPKLIKVCFERALANNKESPAYMRMLLERVIPSLKSTEIKIDPTTNGFLVTPAAKQAEKE